MCTSSRFWIKFNCLPTPTLKVPSLDTDTSKKKKRKKGELKLESSARIKHGIKTTTRGGNDAVQPDLWG